eukprot:scaffold250375_cov26-Prasinocladus_malaysianus.AAC.1
MPTVIVRVRFRWVLRWVSARSTIVANASCLYAALFLGTVRSWATFGVPRTVLVASQGKWMGDGTRDGNPFRPPSARPAHILWRKLLKGATR